MSKKGYIYVLDIDDIELSLTPMQDLSVKSSNSSIQYFEHIIQWLIDFE